jgi:hypothetical protein
MMTHLKNFLRFWYDFMVGDDWLIAAGVVIGLVLSAALALAGDAPVAIAQLRLARRHLISRAHDGGMRRGRQHRSHGVSIITRRQS